MALIPARVKYRRVHRLHYDGHAKGNTTLSFGEYGLAAKDGAWINSNQIEAARIALTKFTKKGGKIWIRVFPDKAITKKPAETRMGKGKGDPAFWVAVVKPGRVMFEMEGISEADARAALKLASDKLPIHCKILVRQEI